MIDFNAWLTARGIDPTTLVDGPTRAALQAAWRAEQNPAPAPTPAPTPTPAPVPAPQLAATGTSTIDGEDSIDSVMARNTMDRARQAGITALLKQYVAEQPTRAAEFEKVCRLAVAGNLTVEQTELNLMRLARPTGPHVHVPTTPTVDDEVLEASICRSAGMRREDVERHFGDRALSTADRHFRSGLGLQRLLTMAARGNGLADPDFGTQGCRSTLEAAFFRGNRGHTFAGYASSGISTINVSSVLSNSGNRFARDAFDAVESAWRTVCAIRPVNDFREITSYALTGDLTYKELGPGGEIKHGSVGEETYGNRAKMWAIMLGLSYPDIRNDDLGQFAKLNRKMGRGGAIKINKVHWGEWLGGQGTFWSAANGNYFAGTSVAFGLAGLGVAHDKYKARRDPDGNPMGTRGRYLVVPGALELEAGKAMRSTRISDDGGEGENNELAGKWIPVSSEYLQDETLTGYSNENYFIIDDPADNPVMEMCFLDGQEFPTIESAEPDFNQLGMLIRAYHGFGGRKQEKRGGFKFKPTAD